VLALIALGLLLLACLGVAGYFYQQARSAVERLADLEHAVPLKETVVVRADGPTIVRQIQGLAKLETSKYTVEKILDAERTRRFVPGFLAGEKLVFVAHGEVVAGLDLSKLEASDVSVTGNTVTLRLPKPEVLYSRIDNERSYVYERETGLLSRPDKDLESRVRAAAEQQIREGALEDGILKEAQASGQKSLEALVRSMGYSEIRFQ
ncbi:MAG: DUF4230 domain-containing protein, partial [Chloroflexota bacterium]|nr:DUF4230 domain-containing protein [Chloroflexota bacterium]